MKSHCNKSIIFLYILLGANSRRGSNLSLKKINISLKNKLFGINENKVKAFIIISGFCIFNLKFSESVFFLFNSFELFWNKFALISTSVFLSPSLIKFILLYFPKCSKLKNSPQIT